MDVEHKREAGLPQADEIDKYCQLSHLGTMPTQNVNLSTHLKRFVETNVRKGRFGNASEVVRAGLRLLEHEQTLHELKIQRLREAARPGIDDVAAGRFTDLPASGISRHLEKIRSSVLRKARAAR